MKKYLQFLLIVLFPYFIVLALVFMFKGYFMDTIFHNNVLYLLLTIFALSFATLFNSATVFIISLIKMKKAQEMLRINMVIKLIHIPAYLLIFIFGLICSITIFTIAITIVLIIFDGICIISSGLIGLGGIIRSFKENKIPIKTAIIHGIFQFVFCVDIISCIVIYKKVKKQCNVACYNVN